jgi:hypothetical protein
MERLLDDKDVLAAGVRARSKGVPQLMGMHAPGQSRPRGPHLEPPVHVPGSQRLTVPPREERTRCALPDEAPEVWPSPASEGALREPRCYSTRISAGTIRHITTDIDVVH